MNNVTQYRSMTDLHRRLPVFYHPWWLDAVCKDWDVLLLIDGDVTGIWPFQKEKKLFLTLVRPPLLTPYLQPLLISVDGDVITGDAVRYNKLLSMLPAYDFLQFQTIPGYDCSFAGQLSRFNVQERRTYFIYLHDDPQHLFSRIHDKRRNDIRKAEKDLSVTITRMPVSTFNELHQQTFSGKGEQYRYPEGFIEKVALAADRHNASICLEAKDSGGNTQAILWAVSDQRAMYYLLSTARAKNRHRGAVSLLIWRAICQAKDAGLEIFDFEGSMDPGIEPFFRRFGGTPKTYLSFEHNRSLIWKIKKRFFS